MTLQRAQHRLALFLLSWVGAWRSCAQRYFCLVASTQAAPLGMIYDDFLGLFYKHNPFHRRELHSQCLPL
jgi:hypothetical protein